MGFVVVVVVVVKLFIFLSECELKLIQIVLVLAWEISGIHAWSVDRRRWGRLRLARDHRGRPDLSKVLLTDQGNVVLLVRLVGIDLKNHRK